MILQTPTINSAYFTHHAEAKLLTAEHSDLGSPPLRNRLYDDACDEGITLVNLQRSTFTSWYLDREERDAEGDITHWVFLPTEETLRKHPTTHGYTLKIFND